MMRAVWPRQMDAMIFIDKMNPSARIKKKNKKKEQFLFSIIANLTFLLRGAISSVDL